MPLEVSGAGRIEALYLSAVITGGRDRAILLDEPALNVHPTIQASLLERIRADHHNQFFVITHSPVLLPADAMLHTSRLYLDDGATKRASLDPGLSDVAPSKLKRRSWHRLMPGAFCLHAQCCSWKARPTR